MSDAENKSTETVDASLTKSRVLDAEESVQATKRAKTEELEAATVATDRRVTATKDGTERVCNDVEDAAKFTGISLNDVVNACEKGGEAIDGWTFAFAKEEPEEEKTRPVAPSADVEEKLEENEVSASQAVEAVGA